MIFLRIGNISPKLEICHVCLAPFSNQKVEVEMREVIAEHCLENVHLSWPLRGATSPSQPCWGWFIAFLFTTFRWDGMQLNRIEGVLQGVPRGTSGCQKQLLFVQRRPGLTRLFFQGVSLPAAKERGQLVFLEGLKSSCDVLFSEEGQSAEPNPFQFIR